ncbi:hypothetical protein KGP26_15325 [Serratia sp. JSRIV002]|uniref:hypothetical protein n=1 Tax=Serratia sp. JSRIV002 TaxID=2831894 RepID=UPI001CBB7E90|nr:hypothetical protein [Serratia sp. JSRIV002]UAN49171.1 hypothetical protein KGP26_15325 [Serratia sp. JSRIV002]
MAVLLLWWPVLISGVGRWHVFQFSLIKQPHLRISLRIHHNRKSTLMRYHHNYRSGTGGC